MRCITWARMFLTSAAPWTLRHTLAQAVLLRDRARTALNLMAPDRRAMRRGLIGWVEFTAAKLAFEARGQAAVVALAMGYKAMKAAVAVWVAMIVKRKERDRKVAICLARTSPEKRDSLLGFEAFACRAPSWERGLQFTEISRNGFGVTHQRDRARDAVIGAPRLHHGDLYTFAFAVVGGGAGVVIGVADANFLQQAAAESPDEQLGGAWGINLSHGALFTKRSFADRGELHAQQILPVPSIDRSRMYHPDNLIEVEVEVDMRAKPYRIAFGLPDEPMVEAATANITSDDVRPWAYLWGQRDSVVLLPRRRPKAPRMQTWGPAVRASLSFRPVDGANARAAAAAAAEQQLSASPSSPNVGAATAATSAAAAQSSASGEVPNAVDPAQPGGGGRLGRRRSGRAGMALLATRRMSRADALRDALTLGQPSVQEGLSEEPSKASPSQASERACSGPTSPAKGPKTKGSQTQRRRVPAMRLPPDDYTYHDDPKRKAKELKRQHETEPRSHLLQFSFRAHEELMRKGQAPKRHPWDRARPVNNTYADWWSQQV